MKKIINNVNIKSLVIYIAEKKYKINIDKYLKSKGQDEEIFGWHLTPTEVGKRFNLKANRINEILEQNGYQYREGKTLIPTEKAKDYIVYAGAYTRKLRDEDEYLTRLVLRWKPEIVEVIKEILDSEGDRQDEERE